MKYRIREQNELKPSGVEWLGDIPKDWNISKLKFISNIVMGQSPSSTSYNDKEIGLPLIQGNADCKDRLTLPRNFTSEITKVCNIGDIILTVRAPVGAVSKSLHHACIGRGVCSINSKTNNQFLYYYLIFHEKLWGKFTQGSIYESVSIDVISNTKIPFINIIEQQKIANFLDEKSKIFDEAISKKEQLISKLEFAKQSLISEVVTGKLEIIEQNSKLQSIKREENELKPSGVAWLGDIPKDWQVKKLGYIFSFKNGVNTDSSNYGKGIKFINVKETINTNFIMENDIEGSVSVSDSIIKENLVRKGDVLFNRTSETIEELALSTVYYDDKVALFGGFVIRGRQITKDLDLDFKRYCFQSIEIRKQIISYGSGSIRKNIAQTNLKNVYLIVPTITEQQKISKYLDEKLIHFDNTIEKTKKSIKKLKEAKEALISQAVTGKIEVL